MSAPAADRFVTAGRAAFLSAAVAAAGIVFLVLLYVGLWLNVDTLLVFGPLNDVCVVVQYLLILPVVFAFHRLLSPHAPGPVRLATVAGLVGLLGTTIFQLLLLTGRMAFADQVGYAAISVLLIGVWILITGVTGRRLAVLPFRLPLVVLAALYFGFPVWVYRVGRELRRAPGAGGL